MCSNASDHGSEDTFISLGTKIKAKAQSSPKHKQQFSKNYLKYRNMVKKDKKNDLNNTQSKDSDTFNLDVKIKEKNYKFTQPNDDLQCCKPSEPKSTYESYFLPFHDKENNKIKEHTRQDSSTPDPLSNEVDQAIDYYSRQLTLTKQQLSLVEEESTQDFSSLSPENSMDNMNPVSIYNVDEHKIDSHNDTNTCHSKNTNLLKDDYQKISHNFINKMPYEERTYKSFYSDIKKSDIESMKSRLSSTLLHTDISSKDSGYTDSGSNDEKPFKFPLANASNMLKKDINHGESKSLDNSRTYNIENTYLDTYPPNKKKYDYHEPINHSRLLYKNFFLKKEINGPKPPQNSPSKSEIENNGTEEFKESNKELVDISDIEYPKYLLNSSTKAYTSKVIDDYKKEIDAINNLHELTLKDIKSEAISPTPLNIDKMFEQNSGDFITDSSSNSQESNLSANKEVHTNVSNIKQLKKDISLISTKELIHDYLKVKENDYYKEPLTKTLRKIDAKYSGSDFIKKINNKKVTPRNPLTKTEMQNFASKTPLSARIESVQNDKDIDSWMSLSAPSPRVKEISDNEIKPINDNDKLSKDTKEYIVDIIPLEKEEQSKSPKDIETKDKAKDLDTNASVLDIYSMLKEIESYGEHPVAVEKENINSTLEKDDKSSPEPKDNFM